MFTRWLVYAFDLSVALENAPSRLRPLIVVGTKKLSHSKSYVYTQEQRDIYKLLLHPLSPVLTKDTHRCLFLFFLVCAIDFVENILSFGC